MSRLEISWGLTEWGLLLLILASAAAIVGVAAWWTRQQSFSAILTRLGGGPPSVSSKKQSRTALLRSPFPGAWLKYLRKNVRVYSLLTPAEQQRLHNDLRIFAAEKRWEGCGGLVITDEIKVTIAAQACLLLLGIDDHDYFRDVSSILVYPSEFANPAGRVGPDGIVHGDVVTLGEAWYRGPVVLSWDDVLRGGRNRKDGHNVVYHEFAHQLDYLGSDLPRAQDAARWQKWHQVMTEEYERLVNQTKHGKATLLDPYGATNSREFFAVATECFFEQSVAMRALHPQLYEVMRDFYRQDSAARFDRHQRGQNAPADS